MVKAQGFAITIVNLDDLRLGGDGHWIVATGAVPQRQLGNLVEVFLGHFHIPQTVGHPQAHDEFILQ